MPKALVPAAAKAYFAERGMPAAKPYVTAAWSERNERWYRMAAFRPLSAAMLRDLRRRGLTTVTLTYGQHHVDFTVAELLRK